MVLVVLVVVLVVLVVVVLAVLVLAVVVVVVVAVVAAAAAVVAAASSSRLHDEGNTGRSYVQCVQSSPKTKRKEVPQDIPGKTAGATLRSWAEQEQATSAARARPQR